MRDSRNVPLRDLSKRELRELVVAMRLRHSDEIEAILLQLPPDEALRIGMERAKKALAKVKAA